MCSRLGQKDSWGEQRDWDRDDVSSEPSHLPDLSKRKHERREWGKEKKAGGENY